MRNSLDKYFYASQRRWLADDSPLKIAVKSRQIGFSYCNALRLVLQVSAKGARLDAFISSRDHFQARLQLEDCVQWAKLLHLGASSLGEIVFDPGTKSSAYVLQFANGRRIYSLSSNPNALAGKRGHVTLDEFALHEDQRLLYRVAKPVTTWGGQLSLISTHRGTGTLFYQLLRDIQENRNPMRWSLHHVPIQKAVEEGLVERINKKLGRDESREAFLQRIRAECIDDEQWRQEYCCEPADANSAFLSYDLLAACEESDTIKDFEYLQKCENPLYLGMDVARKKHLCVIDVGEKINSVVWDRLRLELHGKTFAEMEAELYRLLELPKLKRACIDATGMGAQLAERAHDRFGWKAEPVVFTSATKEELAFGLKRDFEDRDLRIALDDALRADLRGISQHVTPAGAIRFVADSDDGHCDRFWAKALRQKGANYPVYRAALVG
jgi:phage FluMu gp28-like protein